MNVMLESFIGHVSRTLFSVTTTLAS